MSVRVPVAPAVLDWALEVTKADVEALRGRFRLDEWISGERLPTLKQLQQFASSTGVAFGYLLLREPPAWQLPVPDFREGFVTLPSPSGDLVAVLSQSQRRQDWYRDYALANGATPLEFVGSAEDLSPYEAAANIRHDLTFEVADRSGTWDQTRKTLIERFEELGGLTVATSMVENNTHRPLDEDEFRGFALVDPIAPLAFVNTRQTINGQIFTLAHEFAHVWRGASGIGNEDPQRAGQSDVERWCNQVASEVLVPSDELARLYPNVNALDTPTMLDRLAHSFRCGTLVVLQALHRTGIHRFRDFNAAYDAELSRLRALNDTSSGSNGGNPYNNLPFRIGERLSRALIADTFEGRTSFEEAMRLMSIKSLSTFDEYASRLGAA